MIKLWHQCSFWVYLCGAAVCFLVELYIRGKMEYSAMVVPILLSFLSLYESGRLSKKDHAQAKSLQYNDFEKELEQELLAKSLKRWRFLSEYYFAGDGIHVADIENAFTVADESDKASNDEKSGIIDYFMMQRLEQRNDTFDDDCKPIFDYCRRIVAAYKNDNLSDEQLKEVFKHPELTNLIRYGLYYLNVSQRTDYVDFYEKTFKTLSKQCSIKIWEPRQVYSKK